MRHAPSRWPRRRGLLAVALTIAVSTSLTASGLAHAQTDPPTPDPANPEPFTEPPTLMLTGQGTTSHPSSWPD